MKSPIGRLLYVEDHADTREYVIVLLGREDLEVLGAADADKGLELARSHSFDLFLIDNRLPGYSGLELCRKIREFDATTPILFCSGVASEEDQNEALVSGAQGYVIKPFENSVLVAEVRRLLQEVADSRQ